MYEFYVIQVGKNFRVAFKHEYLGELHFCYEYVNRNYAKHIAEKLSAKVVSANDILMNYRNPHYNNFYVSERTED